MPSLLRSIRRADETILPDRRFNDPPSLRTYGNAPTEITAPRPSWKEAGKTLTRPPLERKHLQAGIGYSHEEKYNFCFCDKKGKWMIRTGITTADEALDLYNELSDFGRNVRKPHE